MNRYSTKKVSDGYLVLQNGSDVGFIPLSKEMARAWVDRLNAGARKKGKKCPICNCVLSGELHDIAKHKAYRNQ